MKTSYFLFWSDAILFLNMGIYVLYILDCKPRFMNIFSSSFVRLTFEGGLHFLTNDLKKIIFIKTSDVAMYKFTSPQKREKVLTALLVHNHVFALRTELWC